MVKKGLLTIFLAYIALSLPAQDINLSIRFYDKRIYYIQGSENDPILVQISLANNSPATFRFKLADERAFSVDFDIRTMANRMVDASEGLIRKRSSSRQVFFREIAVEPGETFSFVEDVRDYASFNQPGSFIVQAKLHPELYRLGGASPAPLQSNRLSLAIRPPVLPGPDGIPLDMDVETNALLVREKLAPDEVVDYMLRARQRSQWEKYFLYLDLEALISRDPIRRRQWLAESQEGRRRMVARYRTELQNTVVDGDITTIPAEFEIERTSYGAEEGTVVVLEKFRMGNYTERRRYSYYLRRRDDIWTVIDYSVVNLGTE
jgi:hypothetical protein